MNRPYYRRPFTSYPTSLMCLPDNPYDIDEDVDFAYLRTTYKGNQRGYFIVYNIISEDGDVKNTLNDFVPLQDKITYLDIINIQ